MEKRVKIKVFKEKTAEEMEENFDLWIKEIDETGANKLGLHRSFEIKDMISSANTNFIILIVHYQINW